MLTDVAAAILASLGKAPAGWAATVLIALALIKVWPVIRLQAINARAQLRGEAKDDLHDCRARLEAMETRLAAVTGEVRRLDIRLFGTLTAYRILHNDISEHRPDAASLRQADEAFRTAWGDPARSELVA